MIFGSLFTGIGGIDLGFERTGMKCAWQVEIDDYCNKVLEKHWPEVERFRDVREVGKHNLTPVDIIAGGFPCQDVSFNGLRKGLDGDRSTLWSEFYRIVCEIQPKWIVIENVRGLFSSDDGEFFRKILWELSEQGYDAEWRIIKTGYEFGLPHQRERVFIVAYPSSKRWETFKVFNREPQKDAWVSKQLGITDGQKVWRISNADFCRTLDGFPDAMDRLKALGNAVVPQAAEFIGRSIMEADSLDSQGELD